MMGKLHNSLLEMIAVIGIDETVALVPADPEVCWSIRVVNQVFAWNWLVSISILVAKMISLAFLQA